MGQTNRSHPFDHFMKESTTYFVPKKEKYDNFPHFTPKQLGLNSEEE